MRGQKEGQSLKKSSSANSETKGQKEARAKTAILQTSPLSHDDADEAEEAAATRGGPPLRAARGRWWISDDVSSSTTWLQPFTAETAGYSCSGCGAMMPKGARLVGCRATDVDYCESCHEAMMLQSELAAEGLCEREHPSTAAEADHVEQPKAEQSEVEPAAAAAAAVTEMRALRRRGAKEGQEGKLRPISGGKRDQDMQAAQAAAERAAMAELDQLLDGPQLHNMLAEGAAAAAARARALASPVALAVDDDASEDGIDVAELVRCSNDHWSSSNPRQPCEHCHLT